MLLNVRIDRSRSQHFISTEVDINAPWRQVSSYCPPAETHANWKKIKSRNSIYRNA